MDFYRYTDTDWSGWDGDRRIFINKCGYATPMNDYSWPPEYWNQMDLQSGRNDLDRDNIIDLDESQYRIKDIE